MSWIFTDLSFFLATLQLAITSTCFKLFQPNLDTITLSTSHLCHMTLKGQKVTQGSQGSKVWFCYKKFQLQQKSKQLGWDLGIVLSMCTKVKLKIKFKGHQGSLPGQIRKYFQKIIKNQGKVLEVFYLHRWTQEKILNKYRWPLTPKVKLYRSKVKF